MSKWSINHWGPGDTGVTYIKDGDGISYYSGDAVYSEYFGIREKGAFLTGLTASFEGTHICDIEHTPEGRKEAEYTARLIAASPELLQVCQSLIEETKTIAGEESDAVRAAMIIMDNVFTRGDDR